MKIQIDPTTLHTKSFPHLIAFITTAPCHIWQQWVINYSISPRSPSQSISHQTTSQTEKHCYIPIEPTFHQNPLSCTIISYPHFPSRSTNQTTTTPPCTTHTVTPIIPLLSLSLPPLTIHYTQRGFPDHGGEASLCVYMVRN